jgi:TRAP-type C4-dicarboxylate transport system permease small subunit
VGAPSAGEEVRPGHHVPPDFPAPVRALAALSRALAVLEGAGIAACLVALVALAVLQFVARNLRLHGQVWVPPPPLWIDGVIRHAVFVLGFLGAAYATFTARHIRIDALTRLAPPRTRLALRIPTALAAAAICAVVAWAGYQFLVVCREEASELANQAQLFTSARGAMVIIAGVLVVGFHFLVQVVIDVVYVVTGRHPPAIWVAEAGHGEAAPTAGEDPGADPGGGAA